MSLKLSRHSRLLVSERVVEASLGHQAGVLAVAVAAAVGQGYGVALLLDLRQDGPVAGGGGRLPLQDPLGLLGTLFRLSFTRCRNPRVVEEKKRSKIFNS